MSINIALLHSIATLLSTQLQRHPGRPGLIAGIGPSPVPASASNSLGETVRDADQSDPMVNERVTMGQTRRVNCSISPPALSSRRRAATLTIPHTAGQS